jgi:enamine deaminase RidA (YjgF/YER057c/UK114 family)
MPARRQNFSTGSAWESMAAYARAVRIGACVHVAGTTATDGKGGIVGAGDPRAQTLQAPNNIEAAPGRAGATMAQVARTCIFVTDIGQREIVARAHGEVFRGTDPACTPVSVRALVRPELLVEIEADAYVGG